MTELVATICPNCDYTEEVSEYFIKHECSKCGANMRTLTDILTEAFNIINGGRLNNYGKPEDSFQIIAEFWTTYINHKYGVFIKLDSLDIGHLMSLFKHARMLGQKPNRDNYRDACGYLAIVADRLLKKTNEEN